MRSQPHWLREKEGTENRHQGGVGLWTQHGGTSWLLPRAGPWWRVSGCPHLSSAGQPSPIPTSLRAHQATVHPDGGPAAPPQVSLTSACSAGQTHLEPRSPFCPQPPVPLRGRALPARTLGLPPHPWSGLSVLFGSWKEEKEEGKHFGFYKVKEFIS